MITITHRRLVTRRPHATGQRVRVGALACAVTAALLFSSAMVAAPFAGAATAPAAVPNGDPYEPPSETVQTPVTDDCAQRTQPPPAVDTSEDVPPGATPPEPLPIPANPVGGARLGACGIVVPEGSPPLPSDISAGAWLLADVDTGEVLAAKDPHGRYRPASTLKLLTVLPLLRNLKDLDQIVEGTDNDAAQEGTRVGIESGGKYTIRQLLTYLIITSGNDAANALARANGGHDKTVADMNAAARALGALDTRAATPSGLDGPGQSTSAYDLALFAKAGMATPPFPEIFSSVDVRVPAADGPGYIAANDNQLLYQYPGALGGKTGFTDDAGNTYVGMASRDGRRLVVTMMNGTQQPRRQWMQGASLLDWGFALPASTPPIGTLVGSLAEATAAAAPPTPSTGASTVTGATGSAAPTAPDPSSDGNPTANPDAVPLSTSSGTASGVPTAIILAGIGLLVVAVGVLLLVRRRFLNKKATFAGDATPPGETAQMESDPAEPAATDPAGAPPTGAEAVGTGTAAVDAVETASEPPTARQTTSDAGPPIPPAKSDQPPPPGPPPSD